MLFAKCQPFFFQDSMHQMIIFSYRLAFHEFINNEDIRKLFVFIRPPRQVVASLQPPTDITTKSVFFLKNNVGVKLTKDNMGESITNGVLTQWEMWK